MTEGLILAAFDLNNAYGLVIGASLIIILSYVCNFISKLTNIPSPLLLIGLGILINEGLKTMGMQGIPYEGLVLELLGTVGLIFIVLEAALDLELSREKWPIIWKSFTVALLCLVGSSILVAAILHFALIESWTSALVYAIPLSIMSSAIIIPSVSGLMKNQQEFMIYESTFSDILGIMFFYLLLENSGLDSQSQIVGNVFENISLTIILSVVACYLIIFVLQRLTGKLKLFLTISVLLLLYAVGKLYHLSSLVMILAFGLMLNNYKLFWPGKLRKYISTGKMTKIIHDFHTLTLETAFVVRTFFFVIFGITIVLSTLGSWTVVFYSLAIAVGLYLVRLIFLFIFERKSIFPLLYIAPRGLITILLFFQIQSAYPEHVDPAFNNGILLFVIIATSLVMTISLIQNGLATRPSLEPVDEGFTDMGHEDPPKMQSPKEPPAPLPPADPDQPEA